jgi:hypothetical protein
VVLAFKIGWRCELLVLDFVTLALLHGAGSGSTITRSSPHHFCPTRTHMLISSHVGPRCT